MSEQQKSSKPVENGSRLIEITRILTRHEVVRGMTPEKLRLILEDLGPTYIKLGQIMSTRSDILPQAYCDELMKLRSEVPPMPFEEVIEVIENSYKQPWSDVFQSIEENCLGSASIAQVHRARLITGEEVVIKVQRKGIYDIMKRDIGLMHKAARLMPARRLAGVVDLDMILDELWVVTQEEMNFLKEADSMEEFARFNREIEYFATPVLYRGYTTGRVLVMEYIDGLEIDDREGLTKAGYDLNEIGTKFVDNYIHQVLDDGFFHADPHPGNLRIRDGKALLYLYREEQLGRDLAEEQAESLLSARGYPRCSPGGRLACLRRRLGTQREFPHEIGLFLGYPPEDVAGFIDHSARDYTYSGLWKVYGDAQQAKLTFDRYRRSTDRCCRLWRQGLKLEEILARKAQIQ